LFFSFAANSYLLNFRAGNTVGGDNGVSNINGVQGNKWNQIRVTASGDKVSLYINGNHVADTTNKNRPELPQVEVYASDVFWQHANAKLRRLVLGPLTEKPSKMPSFSKKPSTSIQPTYSGEPSVFPSKSITPTESFVPSQLPTLSQIIITKNNLIDTILYPKNEFVLRFELYPLGTTTGSGNIFRLTGSSVNCCKYIDRWLAMWFDPSSFRISLQAGTTLNGRSGFSGKNGVQGNIWNQIEVTASGHKISLHINGNHVGDTSNTNRPELPQIQVYVSDKFNAPASAKIRQLSFRPITQEPSIVPSLSYVPTLSKIPSLSLSPTISPSTSIFPSELPTGCYGLYVSVNIKTDYFPKETTWRIVDSNDAMVVNGGPYSNRYTDYELVECIFEGTYIFKIFDSYGNEQ